MLVQRRRRWAALYKCYTHVSNTGRNYQANMRRRANDVLISGDLR